MTNKTNVRRRRRRRRNSSMPTLIAILVISIVCLVGLSISLSACSKGKEASSDNVSIEETESTTVEETTTTPPDVTVDIMMIGDILALVFQKLRQFSTPVSPLSSVWLVAWRITLKPALASATPIS